MATTAYHEPVLLNESINGLAINSDGTYADLTFGGGGHSLEILKKLKKGKLYAFDQDKDAAVNNIDSDQFVLVEHNFKYLKNFLKYYKAFPVDGVLADLGVSSYQINNSDRGFAFRMDGELDMRMDQSSTLTAKHVVNKYSEADLHRIFGLYGEVKNAKTLANVIVHARVKNPIQTTEELIRIIDGCVNKPKRNQYYAQVFQALRIEVNKELAALQEMLEQCIDVIKKGGRLVVISYHSLEDRMVKNFINKGNIEGKEDKDLYGNVLKPFNSISKKPIMASEEEILRNPRARSARLRIAERI